MKRFFAILLALALLCALAACGKKPAPGTEETTAETTAEATTPAETSAHTIFPFPVSPTQAAGAGYVYDANEAPIYNYDYVPYPEPPRPTYETPTADLNTAAITTYSGAAGTTIAAPTAAGSTATAASTAAGPTTTAPTTAQATTQPPKVTQGTFTVSVAAAKAAGSAVTERVTTVNSVGTTKERVFVGVKLKDFLAAQNVDVVALAQKTDITLVAKASDGETVTYTYGEIMADRTLLAWEEDGDSLSPPRLCPCNSINADRYLKGVASITLK